MTYVAHHAPVVPRRHGHLPNKSPGYENRVPAMITGYATTSPAVDDNVLSALSDAVVPPSPVSATPHARR